MSQRNAIKRSATYLSGEWFRRQDLIKEVGDYNPKSYSRAFNRMVEFGELEPSNRKGYYRKAKGFNDIRLVIEEVDAGRTTLMEASRKFPWHYHTFCKYVRQCRKGVGVFQ